MKTVLLLSACALFGVACNEKTVVPVTPQRSVVVETPSSNKLWWKGNWNVAQGKLKQQFADLTDDDLLYAEGKEEELYGRLQKKLGKTRAEVEDMLNGMK
jgi:uncharacterized protein YjbJ (UPF0337 family)